MTNANDLTKLVPGFDFLQGLMKTGGAGLPSIGQWIAPTLDPQELQRRIDELRTVQFWLEQNSKLIGTTVQALEVQRMTLATLNGMNLPMAELTQALMAGVPASAPATTASAPAAGPAAGAARKSTPASRTKAAASGASEAGAPKVGAAAPVDPLQWWGALTQQFTELATKALKDSGAEVARNLAGAAVKPPPETASDSIERAMAMSGQAPGLATKASTPAGRMTAASRGRKARTKN